MAHVATPGFWYAYRRLPESVQRVADKNYALLKIDPRHRSLRLKRVGEYWSVRIGRGYRALGIDSPEGIAWFWIGSHAQYDALISS